MDELLLLAAGIAFILLFVALLVFLKKAMGMLLRAVVNSILGLAGIFLLGLIGIKVPITIATLAVVALFGLGGLGAILVLMFFGVKF
jgi:hypothetical protein